MEGSYYSTIESREGSTEMDQPRSRHWREREGRSGTTWLRVCPQAPKMAASIEADKQSSISRRPSHPVRKPMVGVAKHTCGWRAVVNIELFLRGPTLLQFPDERIIRIQPASGDHRPAREKRLAEKQHLTIQGPLPVLPVQFTLFRSSALRGHQLGPFVHT